MQCGPTDKLLQATPGQAAVLEIIAGLTTEPNKVVGAIHPKAMPAILIRLRKYIPGERANRGSA
jgi:hypothetical protein